MSKEPFYVISFINVYKDAIMQQSLYKKLFPRDDDTTEQGGCGDRLIVRVMLCYETVANSCIVCLSD